MFRLFPLLLVIIFFSCQSSSDSGVVFDTKIRIKYMDKSGSNLLNPEHEHVITEENTTLYYLIEGQKEKVNDGSKKFPKGFFITDETGSYEMGLFPNIITGKKTASTLVTFENYSTDTLTVEYVQSNNVTALTKVWYNNQLKWDTNSNNRIIQVTKSTLK